MSNNEKPLTICPLPSADDLEQIKRMTEENDHSGARVAACRWLAKAWPGVNSSNNYVALGGNPFQALLAALEDVAAQHEKFGCLSPALAEARIRLWLVVESVAAKFGLASAVRKLKTAL